MTRTEIIDLANQFTERKGENIIDTFSVMTFILQDFCKRSRFWWRQYTTTFKISQGVQQYDLTTVAPYGSTGTAVDPETTIEEITRIVIVNSNIAGDVDELVPIFDDEAVMEMIEGTAVPVKPGRYTFAAQYGGGSAHTMYFDVPLQDYKVRFFGWAMPNPQSNSVSTQIPIVPPWHHGTVLDGMVWYLRESLYGENDVRAQLAQKRYENGIVSAQMRPRFTTNAQQQFITDDNDSIRSTGPYLSPDGIS